MAQRMSWSCDSTSSLIQYYTVVAASQILNFVCLHLMPAIAKFNLVSRLYR